MSYSILKMLEYILKKKLKYILILPYQYDYTKSYPEIIEDWSVSTPKIAANVGRKFELEISGIDQTKGKFSKL